MAKSEVQPWHWSEDNPHENHTAQLPKASPISNTTHQNTKVAAGPRRNAACDECRKRKLKCTGELDGCKRCRWYAVPCVYSPQKQMGRPRKRQKSDETHKSPVSEEVQYSYPPPPLTPSSQTHTLPEVQIETPIDPSLSNIDQDLTDFQNVCNGPLAQSIRGQREAEISRGFPATEDSNIFAQGENATTSEYPSTNYPTDIALWPDFSTLDKLPLPFTTRYGPDPTNDLDYTSSSAPSQLTTDTTQPQEHFHYDPDTDPDAFLSLPSVPACPCLPNLYLALSTLATLTSYPVSQETITTLLSTHKTAHSVIYCPVCPREFQTGSQNLMLGCTLLNVLADSWHRIRDTPPETLKKGFSTSQPHNPNSPTPSSFMTLKEGDAWRTFARQLIRAYVFGDAAIPKPPTSSSSSSSPPPQASDPNPQKVATQQSLSFLIAALERRQRQWHSLDTPTDEFPDRGGCDKLGVKSGGAKTSNGDMAVEVAAHEYEKGQHSKDRDHDGYLCIGIVHQSRNIVREMDDKMQ